MIFYESIPEVGGIPAGQVNKKQVDKIIKTERL